MHCTGVFSVYTVYVCEIFISKSEQVHPSLFSLLNCEKISQLLAAISRVTVTNCTVHCHVIMPEVIC